MFGIGLEEILLCLFILFLISPKDLPKVMKKIGQFFGEVEKLKKELSELKDDVQEIARKSRSNGINPEYEKMGLIHKKGKHEDPGGIYEEKEKYPDDKTLNV